MGDEEVCIYGTPGVSNNFPLFKYQVTNCKTNLLRGVLTSALRTFVKNLVK